MNIEDLTEKQRLNIVRQEPTSDTPQAGPTAPCMKYFDFGDGRVYEVPTIDPKTALFQMQESEKKEKEAKLAAAGAKWCAKWCAKCSQRAVETYLIEIQKEAQRAVCNNDTTSFPMFRYKVPSLPSKLSSCSCKEKET